VTYLSFPRLHFSGTFQADVSTVNNDPYHFNTDEFDPDWHKTGYAGRNGWWNPQGSGAWRLRDCTVRSVVYSDGTYCDDPWVDRIVEMPVNDNNSRVSGKLADLDPEQQMAAMIFGLDISIGPIGEEVFSSAFEPAALDDMWLRFPIDRPDKSSLSAIYQSVLHDIGWCENLDSRFLEELGRPEFLSIKFTADRYDDDWTSPGFTFGRITGTIGRYLEGEPHHLVVGRRLRPHRDATFNFAVARVEGDQLLVDLANSLPTEGSSGPWVDQGRLSVAILPADAPPVVLGSVDYRRAGWYLDRAAIQAYPLTPEHLELVESTRLGVIRQSTGEVLLEEDSAGSLLKADEFIFRLDPGEPQTTVIYGCKFGRPAAGQRVELVYDIRWLEGQIMVGDRPGPMVGEPPDALTFPGSIELDEQGRATVELVGSDPGNPRKYIDGQVYGIRYQWAGLDLSAYEEDMTNVMSILLWDAYTPAGPPTWINDVQPIFRQYALLYPVMRRVLDLSDYQSCVDKIHSLQSVINLPVTDPNYMPAVRDLSGAKRKMISSWLQNPLYIRVDSVADLKAALQLAIEVEHATIPVYLFALFSIKDGANRAVARLIRSVVVEEMLHVTLACNLLNAIGGSPVLDSPDFVPHYPAGLPGGLRPDLTVPLKKASIQQIRDVFLPIEEGAGDPRASNDIRLTVGWFYSQIRCGFEGLAAQGSLFVDKSPQATLWRGPGEVFPVHDLDSALRAIDVIVEQGEGDPGREPEAPYRELSHFHKFQEIVQGRRLEFRDGLHGHTGPVVTFDPEGVWPVVDNPRTEALPEGSYVKKLSEQFDEGYGSLLRLLHLAFNSNPDRYLKEAVEIMFSLEVSAKGLMQFPVSPGSAFTAGPSFRPFFRTRRLL
jgi:hypothetical protein